VRAAAATIFLAAAPAFGDQSSLHVTATGDVGATDNVFATERSEAESDVFTQVRPGFLFAYDAPRMIHELSAEVELLEYALHSDEPSVTGRLSWRGFFLPGPRSQVVLSADGSTGQLNALTTRSSPETTTVAVTPAGAITSNTADGSEYASYIASPELRLSQGAYVQWSGTDDNAKMPTTTDSVQAGFTLGIERTWRADSLGLIAGGSILRLEYLAPVGAIPGSRLDHQANPNAELVWRHDFDKKWSLNLDGGLVYVNPFGTDPYMPMEKQTSGFYPVAGGLVAYVQQWGRVTISARRVVAPNLLIAENTVDDTALAQLALPLPWLDDNPHLRLPKLVGLASLGIERTQLLDPNTSALEGEYIAGRIDAGIAWTPRPGQSYGIRYEFVYQHASASAMMVVPIAPSFFRDTLFFTFSLRYPDRVVASVPRGTDSVRADRKDLAPVGAEPVVPDPTLPTEGEDDGTGEDRP